MNPKSFERFDTIPGKYSKFAVDCAVFSMSIRANDIFRLRFHV
jgi:hypothetical protein